MQNSFEYKTVSKKYNKELLLSETEKSSEKQTETNEMNIFKQLLLIFLIYY